MTTNLDGQARLDPLGEFPGEIREHLQFMQKKKAPDGLVERITEKALRIETPPHPNLKQDRVGHFVAGASRWGLVYTSGVLAATAFLTLGLLPPWKGGNPKQLTIEPGVIPRLSIVAQLPLPPWDKQLFEKNLTQIKDLVDQTDELIQAREVREELAKVLATYKP